MVLGDALVVARHLVHEVDGSGEAGRTGTDEQHVAGHLFALHCVLQGRPE